MNKRRFLLLSVCAVLLALIAGFTVLQRRPDLLPMANVASIEKIRVISGSEYDISMAGGDRIHGFLEVSTPTGEGSEVSKAVQKLLNQSQDPRVKLLRKEGDAWRVEIYLKVNGQEVILSDWLSKNCLTWK